MKSKRKILSLAISALLMAGAVSHPISSYAANSSNNGNNGNNSSNSDHDNNHSSNDDDHSSSSSSSSSTSQSSDSDKRSTNDSGHTSNQKITICHVPPGNPANKHTIHIAITAWPAHKLHVNSNTQGLPTADYLGSCNNPPTTTSTSTPETLHVISGCTGDALSTLATKVHSYFEPITVEDTALDDESVKTAVSQCLDKGDSSDSGKGAKGKIGDSSKSASGGQGRGHDSVSDSGHHHRIRGCLNKDATRTADSSKHVISDSDKDDNNQNYHKKLKDADAVYDTTHSIKDPIVVSDSSLDDKDVWKEYKKCVVDASNPNKLDPNKTGKERGDSGHRQHILKSCTDASGDPLRTAIDAYKAKTPSNDLILTATSYNDVSIKQAVDACVAAGAKDTTTTTSSSGASGRLNFREVTSPRPN